MKISGEGTMHGQRRLRDGVKRRMIHDKPTPQIGKSRSIDRSTESLKPKFSIRVASIRAFTPGVSGLLFNSILASIEPMIG